MINDIVNISSQVIKSDNAGIFDEFYLSFLEKCEARLMIAFNVNKYAFHFDQEELLTNALITLKRNLVLLGTKALLIELELYKNENKIEKTQNVYGQFLKYIMEKEFKEYFYHKYPVVLRLLHNKVNTFCNLYIECISNMNKDKQIIQQELGIEIIKLNSLEFDIGGDTHNNGKCVVKVNVNNGETIYYKPHSLSMDILFDKITSRIMKILKYTNHEFEHIRCVDSGEYGWQERIEYQQCENEFDIENYYYTIGMCLAVFYLLGTEDIHSENLIVNKNKPAFIDLEILLANKNKMNYDDKFNKSFQTYLSGKVRSSVLGTYILPMNTGNNLFDIDLCALTSGQNLGKKSQKISYFKICDNYTSNIHYEKIYSESSETLSIVRFKDKIIDADQYISSIITGFRDSYQAIIKCKLDLVNIIKSIPENNVRQITRATYVYAKFLDAAHHPNYLMSEEERHRLLRLLQGKTKLNSVTAQIVSAEEKMLDNDDIPYFYTDINSCNLYYYEKGKMEVINMPFEKSILTGITEKINDMCIDDMNKQINFIYYSFANYGKHRISGLDQQDYLLQQFVSQLKNGKNIYELFVSEIYHTLVRRIEYYENKAAMFVLEIKKNDEYNINIMDNSLYNGLGIILFIGLAMKYVSKLNIDLMLALINGVEDLYPMKADHCNPGSAFNGEASKIYVYYILAELFDSDSISHYYNDAVERLLASEFSENDEIDYVNGLAGGIVACINIYLKTSDIRLKEIINRMKSILLNKLEAAPKDNLLSGMAHGYSGLIYALMKLYELDGEEHLKSMAIELVKEENKLYSKACGNWKDLRTGNYDMIFWCHGAAGIGLSRCATYQYISHDDALEALWKNDIELCVTSVKNKGISNEKNHGLCHGIWGNLMILKQIAQTFSDKELDHYVSHHADEIIRNSVESGFNYQNKMNVEDVNFMTGLSGIGYALLKMLFKEVPNVLLLEV